MARSLPVNLPYHESKDEAGAARAAADFVVERLKSALDRAGTATLAVSGGSTPRLMFEQLASMPFDWKGVHIFWVDERCVPPDHADSNYGMTRRALLEPAGLPPSQIHRIEGELPPDQAAERYVAAIREFFRLEENTLPRFDVVHLGMGTDAHTASLFPNEPLIHDRSHIAASVYHAARKSYRVTLLPGVLLKARDTLLLVTGADKAKPLRSVFEELYDPLARPTQLFARMSRNVHWFLDRAVAEGVRDQKTFG